MVWWIWVYVSLLQTILGIFLHQNFLSTPDLRCIKHSPRHSDLCIFQTLLYKCLLNLIVGIPLYFLSQARMKAISCSMYWWGKFMNMVFRLYDFEVSNTFFNLRLSSNILLSFWIPSSSMPSTCVKLVSTIFVISFIYDNASSVWSFGSFTLWLIVRYSRYFLRNPGLEYCFIIFIILPENIGGKSLYFCNQFKATVSHCLSNSHFICFTTNLLATFESFLLSSLYFLTYLTYLFSHFSSLLSSWNSWMYSSNLS